MLDAVNQLRHEEGVNDLSLCEPLIKSAQNHATSMAKNNFFSHQGKNGSQPGDRMQRAGYRWRQSSTGGSAAENIAAGQRNVGEVMTSLVNSEPHFKNLINERFTHVGFGLGSSPQTQYRRYWVQNFGSGGSCS